MKIKELSDKELLDYIRNNCYACYYCPFDKCIPFSVDNKGNASSCADWWTDEMDKKMIAKARADEDLMNSEVE